MRDGRRWNVRWGGGRMRDGEEVEREMGRR